MFTLEMFMEELASSVDWAALFLVLMCWAVTWLAHGKSVLA